MKYIVIFGIGIYQIIVSPLIHALTGSSSGCRYQPTCSEYAKEAIEQYGLLKGSGLAIKRLSTCHPFVRS